jgi:hypothetical protein
MAPDDVRFGSLREHRGWYLVEYSPPMQNYLYSILQISVLEERGARAVVQALEAEARAWLQRYPIPLMATAFSADGSVLALNGARPTNYLMAWSEPLQAEPVLRWETVSNEVLPDIAKDRQFLEELFAAFPSKTGREIQAEVASHVVKRRVGWWLVFVWAVVVPITVAVLEWWSDLLGLAVLAFAFAKAGMQALRLTGRLPKSASQAAKEAEELRMRHHHYHCERNPEAFDRLKIENFRREETERTKQQAEELNSQ